MGWSAVNHFLIEGKVKTKRKKRQIGDCFCAPACPRGTFKGLHTCLDSYIAMAQWLSLPVEASACVRFTFHACVRAHNGVGMLLESSLMWRKGWECRCLYNYRPSLKHYLPSRWAKASCTFLLHIVPCSFFTTGEKNKHYSLTWTALKRTFRCFLFVDGCRLANYASWLTVQHF